jgi:hypothetical protein
MSRLALIALTAIAVSGCAPTTKYEWGAYPHALLAYYRTPTEPAEFDKAIDEALAKGMETNRVPPGLFAEAGYEAMSQGRVQQAIDYFNREKAAWPESAAFMDKAIASVGKSAPAASSSLPPSNQSS